MRRDIETEPITLEELITQMNGLVERGFNSDLKVIDIIACLELNKLTLSFYMFQAAKADGVF